MSGYTKGKWRIYKEPDSVECSIVIDDVDNEWFIAVCCDGAESKSNAYDNARRIVACVNACDGISTEQLETLAVKPSLTAMVDEYKQQRDELLSALKGLLAIAESELAEPEDLSEITQAKAAIISAEAVEGKPLLDDKEEM
jgi:hypothetical protein